MYAAALLIELSSSGTKCCGVSRTGRAVVGECEVKHRIHPTSRGLQDQALREKGGGWPVPTNDEAGVLRDI